MVNHQPIETYYKGYRFRSRTEARWAVFFDHMGAPTEERWEQLKWAYETEGFRLSDGTLYLPDFYLKTFDCWVEVKSQEPTKEGRSKCERLGYDSGKPVILLVGTPGDTDPEIFCSDISDSSAGEIWNTCWFGYDINRKPCIQVDNSPNKEYMGPGLQGVYPCIVGRGGLEWCREPYDLNNPSLDCTATGLARSARFEYGEHP